MSKHKKSLFNQATSWVLMGVFFVSSALASFPQRVEAQQLTAEELSQAEAHEKIIFLSGQIQILSSKLLSDLDRLKYMAPRSSTLILPGVETGKHCSNCHVTPEPPRHPLEKIKTDLFQIPGGMNALMGLPQKEEHHPSAHVSAEEQLFLLRQNMHLLKDRVQSYVADDQYSTKLHITTIQHYLSALMNYLIVALVSKPLGNPFDGLDFNFGLRLTEKRIAQLKKYITAPQTPKTIRDQFAVAVDFKNNRMFFTDNFKVNIELSSYLKDQTEQAWLKILKLQTTRYLSEQLLAVSSYWPGGIDANQDFFKNLSYHYRSFSNNFGSLMRSKVKYDQKEFNTFLAIDILERPIPTILTHDRYRDILTETSELGFAIEGHEDEYIERRNFFETEKKETKRLLGHFFRSIQTEPLKTMAHSELATHIRDKIVEIKSQYLREHLQAFFVDQDEFGSDVLENIHTTLLQAFKRDFPFHAVLGWVSGFKSPAADRRIIHLATNQVPASVDLVEEADQAIQTLLLYKFNSMISWSDLILKQSGYSEYNSRRYPLTLKTRWNNSGMNKEKLQGVMPPKDEAELLERRNKIWGRTSYRQRDKLVPDPKLMIDALPVENFPEMPVITLDEDGINFSVLASLIKSGLRQDVYLFKNLQKFSTVSTKQELITAYQALVSELKHKINNPGPLHTTQTQIQPGKFVTHSITRPTQSAKNAQHEKEKLQGALEKLEKMGKNIEKMDPAVKNLDDFFGSVDEKIEFFKSKRDMLLNYNRLLALEMKTNRANPISTEFNQQSLFKHIQDLNNQDGVLKGEVLEFLNTNERHINELYRQAKEENEQDFTLPKLKRWETYNYSRFHAQYLKKAKDFFSDEDRDDAIRVNKDYIDELRELESRIKYSADAPGLAYEHPEYFIDDTSTHIRTTTLSNLKRVQALRLMRKAHYLKKGGYELDAWIKSYMQTIMVRQALIQKDILIRQNIYKIIKGETIEEIKEFILDPYVLQQALKMINEEHRGQAWRVKVFEQRHQDMLNTMNNDMLDRYFNSSWHSTGFWAFMLIEIALILAPVPGSRVLAGAMWATKVTIGAGLLIDFTVQTAKESKEAFWDAPEDLQNKKDFFDSTVYLSKDGPGRYQDFDILEAQLNSKQNWAYFSIAMLFLWGRGEIKRGVRFLHTQTRFAVASRIPKYAERLGILEARNISLTAVEEKIAHQIGTSAEVIKTLSYKEFIKLSKNTVGKKAGRKLFDRYQFFSHPRVIAEMQKIRSEVFRDALKTLGIESPSINTLQVARSQADKAMRANQAMSGGQAVSGQSYDAFIQAERGQIEQALKTVETHIDSQFYAHPELALEQLGLTLETLPSRVEFEAFYQITHGNADKVAAWKFLDRMYKLEGPPGIQEVLSIEFMGMNQGMQDSAQLLREIILRIPN